MKGMRAIGIPAAMILMFLWAAPLAAEEKTFHLDIPGCTS